MPISVVGPSHSSVHWTGEDPSLSNRLFTGCQRSHAVCSQVACSWWRAVDFARSWTCSIPVRWTITPTTSGEARHQVANCPPLLGEPNPTMWVRMPTHRIQWRALDHQSDLCTVASTATSWWPTRTMAAFACLGGVTAEWGAVELVMGKQPTTQLVCCWTNGLPNALDLACCIFGTTCSDLVYCHHASRSHWVASGTETWSHDAG